jgi:hypothetical protein
MRNTLIVRWYDVIQIEVQDLRLDGIPEHDDIVKILQHIEIEIQQIEEYYLLHLYLMTIMTYIDVVIIQSIREVMIFIVQSRERTVE